MSLKKPAVRPSGHPDQFSTSQLSCPLYMTGLAGPARLSDQMPCSGAGTAVTRSGHFNTTFFRPIFYREIVSMYSLHCCFLSNVVDSSFVQTISHVMRLVKSAAAFPSSKCVFIDLIFLCNTRDREVILSCKGLCC